MPANVCDHHARLGPIRYLIIVMTRYGKTASRQNNIEINYADFQGKKA